MQGVRSGNARGWALALAAIAGILLGQRLGTGPSLAGVAIAGLLPLGLLLASRLTARESRVPVQVETAPLPQDRFRRLVQKAPIGLCITDERGSIRYINPSLAILLGRQAGLMAGRNLTDFVAPEDVGVFSESLRARPNVDLENFEARFVRPDGTRLRVQICIAPAGGTASIPVERVVSVADLTASRRANEAASAARAAIEAARMGTWEWDFRRGLMSWSESLAPLAGLAVEGSSTTERDFFAQIHEEDRADVEGAMRLSVETGADFNAEFRVVRPDASTHWIATQARLLVDEEGKDSRLVGIGIDITARKRAEERLKFLARAGTVLSQSLNDETTLDNVARLVVPAIADWCFVEMVEPDGSVRRHALFHSDPAKMALATPVGRDDAFAPDARHAQARVLRTGQAELYPTINDAILQGIARDEQHLEVLRGFGFRSAISAPMIARGRTLGVISVVTAESGRIYDLADLEMVDDLAARVAQAVDNARLYRESREAIRSMNEAIALLDTLFYTAPVGLAYFDHDLQLVRMNGTLNAICGLDPNDALERWNDGEPSPLGIILGPELGEVLETGRPILDIEVDEELEASSEHPRCFVVSYYPVHSQLQELWGVGVVVVEVTERKHSEMLLEQANVALEGAGKAKDRFLADLSHELRTPLTPVLAAVSAMLDDPDTPPTLGPTLEMTKRNIELEARLIDDLLDITRISQGKLRLSMEVIHAHVLLQRALEVATADMKPGQLTIETELHADDVFILVDMARMQQVFWNLLKNALKFTPAGGHLVIRTFNVPGDEPDGRPRIVLEFSDDGVGISPEVLPKIFNAFEQGGGTTTRRFGGLGLGLAICRGVTEALGGTLSAYSPGIGKGATFRLEFPTAPAPIPAPRFAQLGPDEAPGNRACSILLVEDDPDTLRVMANLLRRRGHEVLTADSIAAALNLAATSRFDILVSDLGLPDGTGIDLIRQLREDRDVPALALSGYGMEADVQRCLSAGFRAHLTKPVNFSTLESEIQRLATRCDLVAATSPLA
ncbi:PAS domain S-box protein [Isosphaeraceae bacterium EP7]